MLTFILLFITLISSCAASSLTWYDEQDRAKSDHANTCPMVTVSMVFNPIVPVVVMKTKTKHILVLLCNVHPCPHVMLDIFSFRVETTNTGRACKIHISPSQLGLVRTQEMLAQGATTEQYSVPNQPINLFRFYFGTTYPQFPSSDSVSAGLIYCILSSHELVYIGCPGNLRSEQQHLHGNGGQVHWTSAMKSVTGSSDTSTNKHFWGSFIQLYVI